MTQSLTVKNLHITLRGKTLLQIPDLRVDSGKIVALMGPSGSGKTSLLYAICGLIKPPFSSCGRVWINGDDLTDKPVEQRRIGLMFQDPLLFNHLSVSENVGFALRRSHNSRSRIKQRVQEALAAGGLQHLARSQPDQISGGERSRVALLRCLLSDPMALLLDEPFSSLDAPLRDQFADFLFTHVTDRAIPTLFVTHDPLDAQRLSAQVFHLKDQSIHCAT